MIMSELIADIGSGLDAAHLGRGETPGKSFAKKKTK